MRNRLCMFPNLKAEQARAHMTNQDVADVLKITRVTYETKKKSGRFWVHEAKQLCNLFKCEFNYLFATLEELDTA